MRMRPGFLYFYAMRRWLLILCVSVMYLLHQDFWNWNEAFPLIFGFLPIGLFYHLCYSVAAALLMWLLVSLVWPSHLETSGSHSAAREETRSARAGNNR